MSGRKQSARAKSRPAAAKVPWLRAAPEPSIHDAEHGCSRTKHRRVHGNQKIRVKNSATAFYLQWVHSSANRTVRARGRSRRQIADERSASISQMRPEIIHTLSTGSCGSPNAKISVRETTFSTPPLSFSTTHERNLFVKNGGPNEKNLWSGGEQLFRGRTLFPITP